MIAIEQESNDHHFQDFDHEAEETLSLCDLVESSNWNNNEEYHQSAADDQQDIFEFFTEDFTASSPGSYPKDHNIIFCGKLIPYKEEAAVHLWKSNPFNISRSTPSTTQQQDKSSYSCSNKAVSQRKGYRYEGYDFSVKQVSTLATCVKPRWYLLAFGHGRFPSEMKLRDIKNRQNRRIPATMFQSDGGGEMVKRSEKRSRSPWKGFWKWTLLEVLGCKSQQQANGGVKASFDCIRHV